MVYIFCVLFARTRNTNEWKLYISNWMHSHSARVMSFAIGSERHLKIEMRQISFSRISIANLGDCSR